jgi:hypothetical protein
MVLMPLEKAASTANELACRGLRPDGEIWEPLLEACRSIRRVLGKTCAIGKSISSAGVSGR